MLFLSPPTYGTERFGRKPLDHELKVAEDRIRDAVADAYEASAWLSDEPTESLTDIGFAKAEKPSVTPTIAAIREKLIPSEEPSDLRAWKFCNA